MSENVEPTGSPERDTSDLESIGDTGRTLIGGFGELPKTDARVVAYEEVDAANAAVSVAMAVGMLAQEKIALLTSVENDLYDLQEDLRHPYRKGGAEARIESGHVARLDRAADHYREVAADLSGRVLPGGTVSAALLFQARGEVRRAERAVWSALERHPGDVNPEAARYLNHLSSLLFVLARGANVEHGDVMWVPEASVRPEVAAEAAAEAAQQDDAGPSA